MKVEELQSPMRELTEVLKYADATVPAYNGNVGERVYADATWTYHYDGHNRLTKAAYRSTGNVENFSTEYAYDRQANLTSDSGRGITRIEYNRFNLPTAIYFGDGHRQTISYDGRGVR